MKLAFRKSFVRDVKRVSDRNVFTRLEQRIAEIESAKTLREVSDVKKLGGTDDCFRIRIGEYRLGIFVRDDEVELVRFLHRRDIYRYFP